MSKNKLVSIIIPTRNSSIFLENCITSIKKQSYKKIELLIVDGNSTDKTLSIARKYHVRVLRYIPKVASGTFDAPYKRNYGVKKAKGYYVYYVDADMELTKNVVKHAVIKCESGHDAVILPEDSFGKGIWASAKNLERRCYWGDNKAEAPRFFKKSVWQKLGGLDASIGGGGDDWDMYQKTLEKGYKVGRIKDLVMHNEGDLKLWKLLKKRFMYGKDALKYIRKRPGIASVSYFPIRASYIKNWKMFLLRPLDTLAFVYMRTLEYTAGALGILYSLLHTQ
ncbi:MAG TPA: glycosyltransferase family A protein [Patescibacteria group bacterium]|nr:glycosyltransferase family A protein [Patescibacteria group bacterium]